VALFEHLDQRVGIALNVCPVAGDVGNRQQSGELLQDLLLMRATPLVGGLFGSLCAERGRQRQRVRGDILINRQVMRRIYVKPGVANPRRRKHCHFAAPRTSRRRVQSAASNATLPQTLGVGDIAWASLAPPPG